jgi:hypothetical protein
VRVIARMPATLNPPRSLFPERWHRAPYKKSPLMPEAGETSVLSSQPGGVTRVWFE